MNTKRYTLISFIVGLFMNSVRLRFTDDESFRTEVSDGVKAIGKSVDEVKKEQARQKTVEEKLITNLDQLSAETKKAMEELTKVKNQQNSVAELQLKMAQFDLQLQREARMAYGNPLQRALANPETVLKLNGMARLLLGKKLSDAHKKALGEDSSPGSILIHDQIAKEIYDTLLEYGAWGTLGVEPMGTKIQKLPVWTADPIAYGILTEGATIPDDANSGGTSVSLDAEIIAVLIYLTLQLLEDNEYNVADRVLKGFMRAFNYRLDYMCFAGDGTEDATNVGVTGIFNAGTAVTAATGRTTVEATKLDDWTKTIIAADEDVLNRDSRWWMHRHNLIRTLGIQDLNGRPIFQTALEAPSDGAIGSILSYPVTRVSAAPNTNAADNKVAAFGDPNAFAVGIRQDFTFDQTDHYRFANLQRAFRAYGRADGKMKKATAITYLKTAAS